MNGCEKMKHLSFDQWLTFCLS